VKELDECNEVLFVIDGRYNVGYEVNKNVRYRKQFGYSTLIGGF
jgi:adenosine/AMP kinase